MGTESPSADSPPLKPTLRRRLVNTRRRAANWFSRFWIDIRPGPEARRGGACGSVAAALAAAIVPARYMQSGSPDFTVELETADGVRASHPLSDFGTMPPPLKVRFTKLGFLDEIAYEKAAEAVFQTISIPLSAFTRQTGFDPGRLKAIRLRFDRTAASVILMSRIGLE